MSGITAFPISPAEPFHIRGHPVDTILNPGCHPEPDQSLAEGMASPTPGDRARVVGISFATTTRARELPDRAAAQPAGAKDVGTEAYVRLLQLETPGALNFLRAYLFKIAKTSRSTLASSGGAGFVPRKPRR